MSLSILHDFLDFLDASPTPFHAVENLKQMLDEEGFTELCERDSWVLQRARKYYVIRGASIIAFVCGDQDEIENCPLRLIGAHTDSPCLKITPLPDRSAHSYLQLGIEVYGGALLNPWFDRDLSIAGQVSYLNDDGELISRLINFRRPVAVIPSLAIHLNRDVNGKKSVNPQTELRPIITGGDKLPAFRDLLKRQIRLEQSKNSDVAEILDFDLCLYDTQRAALVGMDNQFITSARLDNLLSCFVAIWSLKNYSGSGTSLVVCNDHEEIGSRSSSGALGTLLNDVLVRLYPHDIARQQVLRRAIMISADNAHGIHPNYPSVHDEGHGPIINRGPVLKFNANQRYATSSKGASWLRCVAKSGGKAVPLQSFVTRADMGCGSTIGPLTASNSGIEVIDLGVPTFAMHSIRELAGAEDFSYLMALFDRFLKA
ncbi:MAG: M18 family aminopeptidase [Cellvibrionaceae bacterium]|nr:M18 family aminopeptidase [Cellvibrionaceae bacterium]